MNNDSTCLLCNARGATARPGRLGRYAQTCDRCEQRRGSHLERNRADRPTERLTAVGPRNMQWSARPR